MEPKLSDVLKASISPMRGTVTRDEQPRGATLPQAPEGLTVWAPTPWPDDTTTLGFSVHDLNRLPRILEAMRTRTAMER
jgi:hypothetical protein